MSAMPAGWTGVSDVPRMGTSPATVQRRADRRAEQKVAKRSQQRWAVFACALLVASFGLTVGILDVLR